MTDRDNDSSAEQSLEFYARPGPMTDLGRHLATFAKIVDIPSLARVEHSILLHTRWASAYAQELSPERRESEQLRRVRDLLDAAMSINSTQLTAPRPPEHRVVGFVLTTPPSR